MEIRFEGQSKLFHVFYFNRFLETFPSINDNSVAQILQFQQNQFATRSVSWLKDFIRFESNTIYDINQVFINKSRFIQMRNTLVNLRFECRRFYPRRGQTVRSDHYSL